MVEKIVVKRGTIVIETAMSLGGTGRSGKGTGAAILERYDENVVVYETGCGYRSVTDDLLRRRIISAEMPGPEVTKATEQEAAAGGLLEAICTARGRVKDPEVHQRFYGAAVGELVSKVAMAATLRRQIKADLRGNVASLLESDHPTNLVLDGRNLLEVVHDLVPPDALDVFM